MKKEIVYVFCLLIIAGAGCKSPTGPSAKTGEGMITYSVTYPDSSAYGIKAMFFPKTITLVFKDDRAAFIATGGLGMVQLVNLLDYRRKNYTSLLIDNLRGNYACTLSSEEIKQNENNPGYTIEVTNKMKTIAGIECTKAIVTDKASHSSFDIYYYDKIKFYYRNSPFKDFNNLLFEYTHTINHLTMKLVATKVDFTTPVDTTLFNVRGNYKWVNQKAFFDHLNEL